MAHFLPFRGIRYDTEVAGSLDQLICPPYDVISPEHEQLLMMRSDYNMVRLELTETAGGITPGRYRAAAAHYSEWLLQGVLRRDDEPAYYLLRQRFPFADGMLERCNLIGALRLEEWGESVFPHEDTGSGPKADRLALMEACSANFSPIFGLMRDTLQSIERVQKSIMADTPELEFTSDDGQEYSLWCVTDRTSIDTIRTTVASQPIYIADGHHRYETALEYWARHRRDSDAEFVLMSITALDDPGLTVLPYHRVLSNLSPELFTQVRDRIAQLFLTRPLGLDSDVSETLKSLVGQQYAADKGGIVLFGPSGEPPYLLTVGNPDLVRRYALGGVVNATQSVESWILQEVVFRPILGDSFNEYVSYVHQGDHAATMVRDGQAQMAFILRSLPLGLFETLVRAGIRLPRKSTFFHPKLPAGVVLNPLHKDG